VKPIFYLLFALAITHSSGRTVVSLDPDWKFLQAESPGAEKVDFDASSWRKLDVPHDWSIEGNFSQSAPSTGSGGWLPTGVAWYRKELTLPQGSEGKRVWIEFDGVMHNSDVWLNGEHLGHRPSGYVSFRYDVSDKIKTGGANTLVVKADTSAQPASRWYSGGGIYRHVRMVIAHPAHVSPWGVFISTPEVTAANATVSVKTKLANAADKSGKITLRSAIVGPNGKPIATLSSATTLEPGKETEVAQQFKIPQPKLWSLDSPQLHTLVTRVMAGEMVLDEVSTTFGIRQAEFKSDSGFWLNGKNLKIKGVCLHQDGGAAGVAVPLSVWERRFKNLKALGVNGIRTAHTPPAPEFLDLCDRMGFLVMDEFFDCWTKGKNPHDYHKFFKEWSHRDLREGILRDRNHPSVIIYSVGNEIHDTPKPDLAKPILRGLVDVCHATDPTRPVTQALFRPNVSGDYKNGLADMLDVVGTNYRDQELVDAWKDKPSRKIIGTEQGHDRSSWAICRDNAPYSGQFLWCGIDYLGESRSWPVTVFNGGLLDRAGFVQPRGLERESWWSDTPMVHIVRRIAATEETPADPGYEAVEWKRRQVLFPDWTPSDPKPHEENVEIYSNAEEVELFLNDRSLGKKIVRKDGGASNWKIAFEPGTLKAVARNRGKEVATETFRTAEKAAKIVLTSDRKSIGADWDDVANVEVLILDKNGTLVPNAANVIKFSLAGPGKIVGLDSGSIVSTEPFQATQRAAFQGRALALIRATGNESITLTASSDGLESATVNFGTK
jgi:beta-galactosidase